ncbi:MAG: cellulose biosynthesis cyclic di-GMP-binding regulatory protein BcsB [Ruminococcaceae bacterium]|nr:cellulose biosynthesis cyclic di-GMP-binding regulatory protein BcsB [Oscillospiraceae bacterium]
MVQNRTILIKNRGIAVLKYQRIRLIVLTFVIALSAAFGGSLAAYAEDISPDRAVQSQSPGDFPAVPASPAPEEPAPYLHQEAFDSAYSLTGLFSQCTEHFSAGNWEILSVSLTLRFSASQLADNTISDLTLSLNGQNFYSVRVFPDTGTKQELSVTLPAEAIRQGSNDLVIEASVRTRDSSPCIDDVSKANWMELSKESSFAISYFPRAPSDTLAAYYAQFTAIDALENRQSAVVIGSDPDDVELSAAAAVLAGISGQSQMFYENIALRTVADAQTLFSEKYGIFISRYDSLFPVVKDRLTLEQRQAAEQSAIITLVQNDAGAVVLLITGNSGDALLNAARLLGNASYMAQLQTAFRPVSAEEDVRSPKSEPQQYLRLTDESGSYLKGPFRQSVSFFIQYPANRRLSYSSQISLAIRYAENLNFDRSLVTVYMNENPVGSKKLTREKAQGDTLLLDIPSDLKISGNFTVRVSFDLEMKDLWCAVNQSETPWAWISNESMLKLSSTEIDTLFFENYPSPFMKDGSFNHVVVVMPDKPVSADYEAFRKIMLTFGQSLKDNTGSLRVAHMSEPGDLKQANIISIGRFSENKFAQQVNDALFFRFSADGKTLLSNEKMLIDPDYGTSLGTVQLLDSPYSEDKRALMPVTGASDEAMLRAADYIGSSENLWKIYGDGFVADAKQVFAYRFKPEDNTDRPPVLDQLAARGDVKRLLLATALVLFLLAVAAASLLVKYRKKGNYEG